MDFFINDDELSDIEFNFDKYEFDTEPECLKSVRPKMKIPMVDPKLLKYWETQEKEKKYIYRNLHAIPRYLEKKKCREWKRKIIHTSRSGAAYRRPRKNGKFLKKNIIYF